MAHAEDGVQILKWRQKHSEREGVRYTKCSVLDAALLMRETTATLGYGKQKAMELKPWCVCMLLKTCVKLVSP